MPSPKRKMPVRYRPHKSAEPSGLPGKPVIKATLVQEHTPDTALLNITEQIRNLRGPHIPKSVIAQNVNKARVLASIVKYPENNPKLILEKEHAHFERINSALAGQETGCQALITEPVNNPHPGFGKYVCFVYTKREKGKYALTYSYQTDHADGALEK